MSMDMWVNSFTLIDEQLVDCGGIEVSEDYSEAVWEAGASAPPRAQLAWFARDWHVIVPPDRVPDLLQELLAIDVSTARFPYVQPGDASIQQDHSKVLRLVEAAIPRHHYVWLSAAPGTPRDGATTPW